MNPKPICATQIRQRNLSISILLPLLIFSALLIPILINQGILVPLSLFDVDEDSCQAINCTCTNKTDTIYIDNYGEGYGEGYQDGYEEGYEDGYNDSFASNKITFHGRCYEPIQFWNTASSSTSRVFNFTNVNNSIPISINNYDNNTSTFNTTISNIRLYNSSIIQDNFTEDNSQPAYTATNTLTLYQQLPITENLTLTSIRFIGLATGNARPTVLLYAYNNGIVGSLITTLNASSVPLTNGLQLITLTFSYFLSTGNYFIGIRTTVGSIRVSTSYNTGINNIITLYGASLANIDYAINYTIAPPSGYPSYQFIHYGLLHANHPGSYIQIDFVNYTGHLDYHNLIYNISDIAIVWRWFNVTFDINFSILYGYDTVLSYNTSMMVESMSLRNNQSTNFWGGIEHDEVIPADIEYYTTSDLLCTSFGITIHDYGWRFDLVNPLVFKVGETYNMTVTAMNATIYNLIGTTWECNFEIWYSVNEINYYTEVNHLFIFDVMRL